MFPLFGREVFQEVLEELEVEVFIIWLRLDSNKILFQVIQCSYEADHVIAQMAIEGKREKLLEAYTPVLC